MYLWFTTLISFVHVSITIMADIPVLLLVAALVGAGLNVIRGYSNSDEAFSIKKLTGAIVAAVIGAFAAISVFNVETLGGPVQTFLIGALTGFTADFGLSRLNR
jgi:hypothetical protein